MNAMQQMRDPAAGINPLLLPHLHLTSKNRYPITNNPSLETIVGYLLEAPKIVRDLQPMQWQFLDAPADGFLMLTWQPLEHQGTQFASDGYIYGDAEQSFKSDVRGYSLEMFHQKSGYRAGEAVASHSRRRYRLLTSNPTLPAPDPALFIIHYSKAHGRDTIPAASIPILPHVAQQINQRRVIQASGQLARKDFMLHDRSNWPQINAPQGMSRGSTGHRRGASIGQETGVEEEEDVSRGDVLDFMTPRDISRLRYEQHHEWMEEILESPYNIHQIIPGDLGLGRKGEVEKLTKDFFDAPTTILRETSGNAESVPVGMVDEDKAESFKKRASRKIEEIQTEIDMIKERHAKRMAKMRRTTVLNSAERRLRAAQTASSGRTLSSGSLAVEQNIDPLDEIREEVESHIGKTVERVSIVKIVSRGGLQERHTERTFSTSSASRPVVSPVKTTGSPSISQSALTSQTPGVVSQQQADSQTQPQSDSKPQSDEGSDSTGGEDANQAGLAVEEKEATNGDGTEGSDLPPLDDMGMDADVDMGGLVNDNEDEDDNSAGNEWVVIDEQTAENAEATPDGPKDERGEVEVDEKAEDSKPLADGAPAQPQTFAAESRDQSEPALGTNDFGDDFDNVDVDTAGDALASYDQGDDDDLNLDAMDDSAFGDAFHPDEDADIS